MNRRIGEQIEHLAGVRGCHTAAPTSSRLLLLLIVEAILVLSVVVAPLGVMVMAEFGRLCGTFLYDGSMLGVCCCGAVAQLSLLLVYYCYLHLLLLLLLIIDSR